MFKNRKTLVIYYKARTQQQIIVILVTNFLLNCCPFFVREPIFIIILYTFMYNNIIAGPARLWWVDQQARLRAVVKWRL